MRRQKQKVKRQWLGLFLVAGLVLAVTAAKPAAGAPVRLSWGNAWTEFSNALFEDIGKKIEERTNSAVKFDYFWSGSLTPAREERKLVSGGTVDLTFMHPVYYPDMVMSNWTWALPFNPVDNLIMAKLMYEVYKAFPQMQQEVEKAPVHVIGQWASPPYDFNAKFPLVKIDDLKGKKIVAQGKYEPQWYEKGGATAVNTPSPERFSSLQSGLADGGTGQVAYFLSYKLYDAGARNITYIGVGARTGSGYFVMNKKKWDSLPPDVQKVIHEEWDRFAFETAPKTVMAKIDTWRAEAEKTGFKINMLADDQKKEWARRIEPVIQSYAADIDKAYNQPGLGAKFIKFIQAKQKELGAPVFYEFKLD
jgi:TRAP-type transport system periplasmic protein